MLTNVSWGPNSRSAKREAERIQREMEEREQEELKAWLVAKGKKVSEGEKLDVKALTKVGARLGCLITANNCNPWAGGAVHSALGGRCTPSPY